MQSITLQKLPQLKDKEAIAALNNFIKKLDTRDKKLTKKQTKTLEKLAKGIIASIKRKQSRKPSKETGFASKLRAPTLGRSRTLKPIP